MAIAGMWLTCLLLAQQGSPVDILSGGAGWAGAGILGLVLGWLLLLHLPNKDKQAETFQANKDKQMQEILIGHAKQIQELVGGQLEKTAKLETEHREFLTSQTASWLRSDQERRNDFKENLRIVLDHCQRESSNVLASTVKAIDEVTQAVIDFRTVLEERRKV